MDNNLWRSRAKAVAIGGIVILCLIILVTLLWFYAIGFREIEQVGISLESHEDAKFPIGILILAIVALVIGVAIAWQMWADIKLLKATKMDVPEDALRNVRSWKIDTSVFLIINVISSVFAFSIFSLSTMIINIIWRGWGFFVVGKYINELEVMISAKVGEVNGSV